MRTVFHVGMSKAGSTALQDSLLRSRDTLLEHGVLYPTNAKGVEFNNHRLLTQPLLKFSALTGAVRRHVEGPEHLAAMYAEFVASVRKQIRRNAPACLILSYEHLFRNFLADRKSRLRSELDGLGVGATDVVVYVRRPSARYLSALQQGLKSRGTLPPQGKANYRRPLSCFADIFGHESVHPRLMERSHMSGGSITHDFVESFLSDEGVKPGDLVPPQRTNNSVSAASMLLLDRFRQEVAAGREGNFTLRELHVSLRRAERGLRLAKPRLKPEIAEMIDYSTTDPLWLRDAWDVEFPDFDYARLEAGRTVEMYGVRTLEALIEVPSSDELALIAEELTVQLPDTALTEWVTAMAGDSGRRSPARISAT